MKNRILQIIILLAVLATTCFPAWRVSAAAGEQDQVSVQVLNAQGKALPDVQVDLIVYSFNTRGTTAEAIPAGSCSTDRNGRCQIMVSADAPKDPSGFLHGALDLGAHGKRSVIWPGGLFDIAIQLNQAGKVQSDTEVEPFEYDPSGGVQVIQPQPPFYLAGVLIGLVFLGIAFYLYRRSKAQ